MTRRKETTKEWDKLLEDVDAAKEQCVEAQKKKWANASQICQRWHEAVARLVKFVMRNNFQS